MRGVTISIMIKRIDSSHNIDEYFDCVKDLMRSNARPDDDKEALSKIMYPTNNYHVYVYIYYGKIIATSAIMYEYKIRYTRPKAYIEDVAVHPKHRGKGLGKKMVEHCLSCAKKRNCYKVVLSCDDNVVGFYENLGFKKEINFMVK